MSPIPDAARPPVAPVPVSLAMRLERPVRWLRKMVAFVQEEWRSPVRLPWALTWRAWCLGFTRRTCLYYDLDRNDPSDYLSDYQQNVRTPSINGPMNDIVFSKLGFHLLMRWCGGPCPRLLAVIRDGVVLPSEGGVARDTRRWLEARLAEEGRLVMKPVRAFKGYGFMALAQNPAGWTLNDVPVEPDEATALVRSLDNYIVTTYAQQAAYAREIYPRTANTVRMLTLWDIDEHRPFVAAVAHRFGTSRSGPVDNWRGGMGGLSASIDPETGRMGRGATFENGQLTWHLKHPETDAKIAGVVVTRWDELRDAILALAARLAFAPDLAWDVVVTDEGFEILEVNGASGMVLFQVHRPLLADPRVRRFYEHYGVVPPRRQPPVSAGHPLP